jgi:SAM-dependent methyltransferase
MLVDLEEQQTALAGVVASDFRSKSLNELVGSYVVPGTVLDVGCGSGGMVAWLLNRGHDARGIDYSDKIIEAAHVFLKSCGCDPSRVQKLLVEEAVAQGSQVDNAISMDCLEHQEDDQTMFNNLVRLVKPGGRLLITVPAVPGLFSERDRIVGHYRRYTKERLRDLAKAQPLRIDALRYWNLLGVPPTFLYARVFRRTIHEGFRYGEPTLFKRVLREGLSWWFGNVENRMRPPLGLTLVFVGTRLAE